MSARSYEVFGGTLHSDFPIDNLPESSGSPPDWTLRVEKSTVAVDGEALGSDDVYGDTRVRGFRTAQGFALVFDDTGRFDVSGDGSVITWYRPDTAVDESAQADITSRVLALALHARGVLTLHASAVSIGGSGVAFMAPKNYGKSTLCSALVLGGARALSDDTVPVQPGDDPRLTPGLPRLRLWRDSASRLFGLGDDADPGTRKHLSELGEGQVESRPVPFRAAYVLNPVSTMPDGVAASRNQLDTIAATMMFVRHAKLGSLLTGSESPVMLARSADIARRVPVYALHVLRDLDRLDDVVSQLVSWHSSASNPAGGTS